MNVRTRIDPDCPYAPFTGRGHTDTCDREAHVMLALSVSACIEPPRLRAMRNDHTLCAIVPCACCRRSVVLRWYWNWADNRDEE